MALTDNTTQLLADVLLLATAGVGLGSALLASRRNGKKLDVIHVLVDGNLSEIQAELKVALARIDTLQGKGSGEDIIQGKKELASSEHALQDAREVAKKIFPPPPISTQEIPPEIQVLEE